MKKRSLVAALAMLVVSAIVLTSSTYAWFAASNTATISGVSATTGNSAGSIYISADGSNWATSLTQANFVGVGTNSFPGEGGSLTPVSFDKDGNAWYTGTFGQADGSATSTLESKVATSQDLMGNYIKFTVYMYAEVACTVTVTPTFTDTSKYCYAAFGQGTDYTIIGAVGNGYTPIGSAGTANDSTIPADGIIDAAEAGAGTLTLGNAVEVGANQTLTYEFTADQVGETGQVSFDVYVWAEGQDADCFGIVDAKTVGLQLNFQKVDTQQG